MAVNNRVVTELGTKADPGKDIIKVDGTKITASHLAGPKIYILLNKPKGVMSTLSDPQNRPTVADLVKLAPAEPAPHLMRGSKQGKIKHRVFSVGRLDYDAEGVLLLTNDGELTNKLIHPRYQIPKKYLVKVSECPDQKDIEKLKRGVYLEDGRTLPAEARFIKATKTNSWIELTVYEGRNRLVKRMCLAIGHPVQKLKRIEFAGIKLGSLKPGSYRMLTKDEVERLKKVCSKE